MSGVVLQINAPLRPRWEDALAQFSKVCAEKHALAEWYLSLVERETSAWLERTFAGVFSSAALPHDYLSVRPASQEQLGASLACVKRVLSRNERDLRAQLAVELVQPLRSQVHTALLNYLRSLVAARAACIAALGGSESALRARLAADDTLRADFAAAAADAAHVAAMRSDDERLFADVCAETPPRRKSESPADVVPVTGLIFSALRRLENEMATAYTHHFERSSRRR